MLSKIACTLLLAFICSSLFAQKNLKVGLNFTAEVANGQTNAGIGALIDYRITKHSGMESGIYYRTFPEHYYFYTPQDFYSFTIAERHLSIPVLYKFSSRIVNASFGPTFDFFLGWKQKMGKSYVDVNEYNISPSFNIGAMLKISKDIRLTDKFSLEPEIRLNPIFSAGRGYAGIGIPVKYSLK